MPPDVPGTAVPCTTTAPRWVHGLTRLVITAWVGCLWGIGLLAVPVLFRSLPDNKMLAGMLAGNMFTPVAWLGIAGACYLLTYLLAMHGKRAWRQSPFLLTAAMLLLTLAGEFILQPEMAALKVQALPNDVMHSAYSSQFDLLHHVASTLYLVECLLGAVLVLKAKIC